MKHVYKTHEIAHLWANKKQDDARNPSGNFFFRNGVIYSYGEHFPIARHVNDSVIFMTTRSYSNTTSKHISRVWHSIPSNKTVFKVQSVRDDNHQDNFEYYLAEMEGLKKKINKSVTNGEYYFQEFREHQLQFQEYCAAFKLKPKALVKQWRKLIRETEKLRETKKSKWADAKKKAEERAEYRRTHAEEIEQKRRDNAVHVKALKINDWRDGKIGTGMIDYYDVPMMLRINKCPTCKDLYCTNCHEGGLPKCECKIETIKGASVSLASAEVLYKMIREKRDIKGHVIDGYTVISINGSLKIGCHDIPLSEVDRMATLLNWK